MADYVIKNGLVITPSGNIMGGVAIAGEKISYVGGDAELPKADHVIDAQGKFIIPGFVEVHCHIGICPAHLQFDVSAIPD